MVVVSHDRHLLGLIADRLLLIDDGTATSFDGSLDDYRDLVLGSGQAGGADGQKSAKPDRKLDRRQSAAARERHQALRKQASQAEAEVNRLWQRRAEIDQLLAAPPGNGGPSASELMKTRAEVERHLASAEHRWLEASEAAERARAGRSREDRSGDRPSAAGAGGALIGCKSAQSPRKYRHSRRYFGASANISSTWPQLMRWSNHASRYLGRSLR